MAAPRLVVAAVIVDDLAAPQLVLAARRSTPAALAGCWEFPGGKVEPGESPQRALAREIREELGTEISLGEELLTGRDHNWPISEHYEMRVWWAVARSPVSAGGSHDEVSWLPAAELSALAWLPADVAVADRVRASCAPTTGRALP